jgi:hypothetical protein
VPAIYEGGPSTSRPAALLRRDEDRRTEQEPARHAVRREIPVERHKREPADSVSPGLSPIDALRAARRTLEDALSRIKALEDERAWLDRELKTWDGIASHSRGLIEYYERRLHAAPELLPTITTQSARRAPKGSPERFGALVKPLADRLITERGGPVPVDDVYAALPPNLRSALDSASSTYSAPFRLRRMFRRDRKYEVTEAGVALAGMTDPVPDGSTTERVILRPDGSIAWFEVRTPTGEIVRLRASQLRSALRAGKNLVLPAVDGRTSRLRLAGNRFFAQHEGVDNNDYSRLPQVQEANAH